MNLAPIATQLLECTTENALQLNPPSALYVRSGAHSGRVAPGGRCPGLKPWAKSFSPFGAGCSLGMSKTADPFGVKKHPKDSLS
jgi:hypothetical protein